MPYPEDLLEQALHLASREKRRPKQASLRRAVSTAYYALFHLLISEATLNWRRAEQRPALARLFDHGRMKTASESQRGDCNRTINSNSVSASEIAPIRHLLQVVDTFVLAHQLRATADYDNSEQWTRTEVLDLIEGIDGAFRSWRGIRNRPEAQAFLLSLLGNPKRM